MFFNICTYMEQKTYLHFYFLIQPVTAAYKKQAPPFIRKSAPVYS